MASRAREEYEQAYHRVRTLHSLELYRMEDHYPIGFDCPDYGHCETIYTPCHCWFEHCREVRAQTEALNEAKALLEQPPNRRFVMLASKSYSARLEFCDLDGKPYVAPLNRLLAKKLAAKRTYSNYNAMRGIFNA